MDNKVGKERRQFERIEVSFIVVYKVNTPLVVRIKVGDKWFDGIALDLSEGGMAILTNHELPSKTLVTVKFILINDRAISSAYKYRAMETEAEVCYARLTKGRGYRIGIRFTNAGEEERTFIARFVKAELPAQKKLDKEI
ncbi:MAG: PilZ domain-containing protein [Candidatus Omnitrophota bacterium]